MIALVASHTVCTLLIMLVLVLAGYYNLAFALTSKLEKYMHVVSGAIIFTCGAGVLWMGW